MYFFVNKQKHLKETAVQEDLALQKPSSFDPLLNSSKYKYTPDLHRPGNSYFKLSFPKETLRVIHIVQVINFLSAHVTADFIINQWLFSIPVNQWKNLSGRCNTLMNEAKIFKMSTSELSKSHSVSQHSQNPKG